MAKKYRRKLEQLTDEEEILAEIRRKPGTALELERRTYQRLSLSVVAIESIAADLISAWRVYTQQRRFVARGNAVPAFGALQSRTRVRRRKIDPRPRVLT